MPTAAELVDKVDALQYALGPDDLIKRIETLYESVREVRRLPEFKQRALRARAHQLWKEQHGLRDDSRRRPTRRR